MLKFTQGDEPMVTINLRELRRLQYRSCRLECLEAAGVDNWEHYDQAMEDYFDMELTHLVSDLLDPSA